jgi:RNA recognition motif-containing protein
MFDMKAIMEKKKAEEELESLKKVDDPFAVKLTNVPAACTELDITSVMQKFGKIEQCYIPIMENPRSNKIAIVRYKFKEEASRAVEEAEVNIEFSVVSIERAIQRQRQERRDRDGGNFGVSAKDAFSDLKRSNR